MFPRGARILVVDDFPTMRKIIKKKLLEWGYTDIQEASDGMAGWIQVKESLEKFKPFDLIISDWDMPHVPGLEFLKMCRLDPLAQDVCFILVTEESEANLIREAAAAGVSDYLVKPFNAATLRSKMERVYLKKYPGLLKKAG
jgi:two-component system chemotaxis response regulator CheY